MFRFLLSIFESRLRPAEAMGISVVAVLFLRAGSRLYRHNFGDLRRCHRGPSPAQKFHLHTSCIRTSWKEPARFSLRLRRSETQILISNSEYVLVTISFVVIFSLCKRLDRIIQVVGLVVAVSAGINLIEYYLPQLLPVSFTTVPGRAAGFAYDPNELAAYICLPLPLVAFFAPRLMRYMWYTIALVGIVVTFSRGGMVLWVAAVVVTEALKQRERTGLRFTGVILLTSSIPIRRAGPRLCRQRLRWHGRTFPLSR